MDFIKIRERKKQSHEPTGVSSYKNGLLWIADEFHEDLPIQTCLSNHPEWGSEQSKW